MRKYYREYKNKNRKKLNEKERGYRWKKKCPELVKLYEAIYQLKKAVRAAKPKR